MHQVLNSPSHLYHCVCGTYRLSCPRSFQEINLALMPSLLIGWVMGSWWLSLVISNLQLATFNFQFGNILQKYIWTGLQLARLFEAGQVLQTG